MTETTTGHVPDGFTDAEWDGDPSVWGVAAPPADPGTAPGADVTAPPSPTWDPSGMIADAYAGRPISDADWEMLTRWFTDDEAENVVDKLRSEGACGGWDGAGRDTGQDGPLPGGGPGPNSGWKARLYYWLRFKPISNQASPPLGPFARSIKDICGSHPGGVR